MEQERSTEQLEGVVRGEGVDVSKVDGAAAKPAGEELSVETDDQREIAEAKELINAELAKPMERTKESEIQANIDFWMRMGVDVAPDDVKKKIESLPEVPGFDWYIYVPGNLSARGLVELLNSQYQEKLRVVVAISSNNSRDPLGDFENTGSLGLGQAVAVRHQKMCDADSLINSIEKDQFRKSAYEWVTGTREELMNIHSYLVANARWFDENGELLGGRYKYHMHDNNGFQEEIAFVRSTSFPWSYSNHYVLAARSYSGNGDHRIVLGIHSCYDCKIGVRRAITHYSFLHPEVVEQYQTKNWETVEPCQEEAQCPNCASGGCATCTRNCSHKQG